MKKENKDNIKEVRTLEDLEKILGKKKVAKLFLQHYLKTINRELQDENTDFDINEIMK